MAKPIRGGDCWGSAYVSGSKKIIRKDDSGTAGSRAGRLHFCEQKKAKKIQDRELENSFKNWEALAG